MRHLGRLRLPVPTLCLAMATHKREIICLLVRPGIVTLKYGSVAGIRPWFLGNIAICIGLSSRHHVCNKGKDILPKKIAQRRLWIIWRPNIQPGNGTVDQVLVVTIPNIGNNLMVYGYVLFVQLFPKHPKEKRCMGVLL